MKYSQSIIIIQIYIMNKYLNVPCAFHTNQIITHFCHNKQCMLPLCRTCISIHQKQHMNMDQKPIIGQVYPLIDKIKTQLQMQKDELRKKNILVQKQMRLNEDNNQTIRNHLEAERTQLLNLINQRFNQMLQQLKKTSQIRQQYLYNTKYKLESIQNILSSIQETFYKGKLMRSVIMWQSQQMNRIGNQLHRKIDLQLTPDKFQFLKIQNKNQLINKLTKQRLIYDKNKEVENSRLVEYSILLNKIIPRENGSNETERISENRKSLNKLRNSGISLTQVSSTKLEVKKILGNSIKTPEKIFHSNLNTVRNENGIDVTKSNRII